MLTKQSYNINTGCQENKQWLLLMFSAVVKIHDNSIAEFPVLGDLVAREFNVMWQLLIFNSMIYIVRLYRRDYEIYANMLGCRVVALPTTEQTVTC